MNRIEQLKADKDGLRVGEDLDRFVAQGLESLTDDDIDRLKWWGIFLRKQTPGDFMLRVRMPRGIANAEQLRALGEISQRYGRNRADLTTRQQLQLRWIRPGEPLGRPDAVILPGSKHNEYHFKI